MVNVYDDANALAAELQKTEEVAELKKALETISKNPDSLKLYHEMDHLQQEMMYVQQQGKAITDDMKQRYQEVNERIAVNADLKDMIAKERAVFKIINDIQNALTEPLTKIYDDILN